MDFKLRQSGEEPDEPQDLHAREYAVKMCEDLCFPMKAHLDVITDCITLIAKKHRRTHYKAFDYLRKAVNEAKKQGVTVNTFWFRDAEFMNVKPEEKVNVYDRETKLREAWARHGCHSGWVYADKGVKRCEQCKTEAIR